MSSNAHHLHELLPFPIPSMVHLRSDSPADHERKILRKRERERRGGGAGGRKLGGGGGKLIIIGEKENTIG